VGRPSHESVSMKVKDGALVNRYTSARDSWTRKHGMGSLNYTLLRTRRDYLPSYTRKVWTVVHG
jgi:hypothetical protein